MLKQLLRIYFSPFGLQLITYILKEVGSHWKVLV